MRKLTLLTAILIALSSCMQQAEEPKKEVDENAKMNIEVAKKFMKAMEMEDIQTYQSLLAEDAVFVGPVYGSETKTDSAHFAGQAKWFESVDSLQYNVLSMLHETVDEGDLAGDWVLIWCYPSWYAIKYEKSVKIMAHFAMRIEDSKIVYGVSYWNQLDLYKQLGAKVKWPEKEE